MSRCFPFPPPGYDKKPIPEDANVLKEERQKEKKHKKDKKNKEKREGKEKRDKERSEGKHKEKRDKKDKHKDKKERHREKKEKKDRGKEKEKSGSSEVIKVSVAEGNFWEKLVLKDGKDYTNCLDENTYAVRFHGQNGEEPVQCNFIARGAEESKYVQDLGRRIKDQEKVTSNHLERLPGAEKKRDDERERFGVSNPRNSGEEKGKSRNKEFDIRKMDGQGYREEARFSGHAMAQNIVGAAKTKASEMPTMVEKSDERRLEGKEQTKDKREKRGDDHKDKDTGKKDHGKGKDRAKERKKEEKAKNKSELDKFIDANRSNLTSATHMAASNPSEPSNKIKAEGNLRKRKDLEINGFHDNEIRPSKLQRPASHPVMENGRKFEGSRTPGFFASDMTGASLKLDNKKHVKNGTVESQPLPLHKEKPSTPIVSDVILEVSKKHPHPDSKYLNQVLSVPKMDAWPYAVDNDWLSDSKECLSRKSEVGRVVSEKPTVWSNTLYLESADVVALPYVVPY